MILKAFKPDETEKGKQVKIEFLYFEGCPHFPPALALLKDLLRQKDAEYSIEMTRVDSEQYARKIRFSGSPSIRINGKDIDETGATDYGIKCRIYRGNDGPTGIPPEALLRKSVVLAKEEKDLLQPNQKVR